MSTQQIDRPAQPHPFDCATTFKVPSDTRPHEEHQIELDAYQANGMCSCESFWKFGALLAKGYTPARALAEGLVSLKRKGKPDKHPDDALRCKHIIEAYRQMGPMCVRAISNAKKHQTHSEDTDPPPF